MRTPLLLSLLFLAACGKEAPPAGGLTDEQVLAFVAIYPRYIRIADEVNDLHLNTEEKGIAMRGEVDGLVEANGLSYERWSEIYRRVQAAKKRLDQATNLESLESKEAADCEALLRHWDAVLKAYED